VQKRESAGTVSRGRSPIPSRHDPVAVGKFRLQQYRFDPLPGIARTAHVKLAPNPGAESGTSPMRAAVSSSRGGAAASSNGQSWLRNAQASAGSPMIPTTSASGTIPRPCLRIWRHGSSASCSGCKRRRNPKIGVAAPISPRVHGFASSRSFARRYACERSGRCRALTPGSGAFSRREKSAWTFIAIAPECTLLFPYCTQLTHSHAVTVPHDRD